MREVLNQTAKPEGGKDLGEFHDMLSDFVLIAGHLAPLCDDVSHLIAVVKEALASETQMQFLANVLKKAAKK